MWIPLWICLKILQEKAHVASWRELAEAESREESSQRADSAPPFFVGGGSVN
jgi:hypothetical protein